MGAKPAGPDRARGAGSATLEDGRGEAYLAVEKAYFKKDTTAFYEALEAYGRACFRFASEGGEWPIPGEKVEEEPTEEPKPEGAKVERPPAPRGYEIHSEPMKLDGTFHYIVARGADPKDFGSIVALCPRREDAERVRKALEAADL